MQHARGATAEFKSTDRFKSIARVLLQQALARRVHRGNGCCLYRPEAAHLLRQAHQRQRRIVAPGIQRAEDAIQERAVINDQLPLLATFRQLADGIQPGAAQTLAVCPVSYTHLRAHETVLDLVCRLLLEKKNMTNKYTSHSVRDRYIRCLSYS